MCGIIGGSSLKPINKYDIRLMYLLAEQRGGHACGYTDLTSRYRNAVTADKFLEEDFMEDEVYNFIGHTRYATKGDRYSTDNAHPFEFERVLGVHNGTIFNHDDLQKQEETDFKVDSEFLYYMIDKYKLINTLPKLQGKLALAYYTKDSKIKKDEWVLTLFRFDRPLWIGYKNGALLYGSDESYLTTIGCDKIKEIPENTIYKICQGKILETKQVAKAKQPQPFVPKTEGVTITKEDDCKVSGKYITKKPKSFYAPCYAKLVEFVKGKLKYFKMYWWEDDDDDILYVEEDDLSGTYCWYDLSDKEGVADLKSDHEDIYDIVLKEHAEMRDRLMKRDEQIKEQYEHSA